MLTFGCWKFPLPVGDNTAAFQAGRYLIILINKIWGREVGNVVQFEVSLSAQWI